MGRWDVLNICQNPIVKSIITHFLSINSPSNLFSGDTFRASIHQLFDYTPVRAIRSSPLLPFFQRGLIGISYLISPMPKIYIFTITVAEQLKRKTTLPHTWYEIKNEFYFVHFNCICLKTASPIHL